MRKDREFMELAIAQAKLCTPSDAARIPRVGAVIAHKGTLIAEGRRGPENRAEFEAILQVRFLDQLQNATVYTTLEPCTGAVRSKPLEACTNLLTQHQVRRVVIGILDPNQGVCGKGVLELQKHNIEVRLFDHDLAQEICALNAEFIRAQQSLGLVFLSPEPGAELHTYRAAGAHEFHCRVNNAPDDEIYVLVERGGLWWPQSDRLRRVGDSDEYRFRAHFGTTGEHRIHVVRASPLGVALIGHYSKTRDRNQKRRTDLSGKLSADDMNLLGGDYAGIQMPSLPRGLDSQGSILVNVVPNPNS